MLSPLSASPKTAFAETLDGPSGALSGAGRLRYDWDMEQFQERVKEKLSEGEQKLQGESRDDTEFRDGWKDAKTTTVLPALNAAAVAMRGRNIVGTGSLNQQNGGVALDVYTGKPESPRSRHVARLQFEPAYKEHVVECTATPDVLEPETFTLDGLDTAAVEHKVMAFLDALILRRIEQR